MGLRPMRAVAPPAFLGSWVQVLPVVQGLVGGAPLLGPGAVASPLAEAVVAAEADWLQLAAEPAAEPADWAAAARAPGGLR